MILIYIYLTYILLTQDFGTIVKVFRSNRLWHLVLFEWHMGGNQPRWCTKKKGEIRK